MVQKVPYSPDGGRRMPMSEMGLTRTSIHICDTTASPEGT